jgi:plastocyanin
LDSYGTRQGGRRDVRRSVVVAFAVLALGLFVGACGGDDDDDSDTEEASATDVTVTATEYAFELSATPTADTQEVTLQNDGKETHALIFARINEGFTLDKAFKLQGERGSAEEVIRQVEAQPGQSKSTQVEGPLDPGTYAMVCPVATKDGELHFDLGQREEFEIE